MQLELQPLIIIAACLFMIPVYFKTTRFDRFWGILLFLIGFGILFYRLNLLPQYPLNAIYEKIYFLKAFILLGTPFLLTFIIFLFRSDRKKWLPRFLHLVLPYVFFGALQQIFFLWVFTDPVLYFTKNITLTFIISVLFYTVFHLNWSSEIRKYLVLLIVFSVLNTYIYLYWRNILPQMLFHGFYGTLIFSVLTKSDQLKNRLGKSQTGNFT